MAPKTTRVRKRGKCATSFRRDKINRVHSGKKFKQSKKLLRKKRKNISDSTFDIDELTQHTVSTPVGTLRGVVGKRKARPLNGEQSILISGVMDDGDESTKVAGNETPSEGIICGPKNIMDMFRNEQSFSVIGLTEPSAGSSSVSDSVKGQTDQDNEQSVIVIDDDDDTLTAVEEVGREMLQVVGCDNDISGKAIDQDIPDTPRTIIKNMEKQPINDNDTIVIDDTIDDSGDDLLIVDQKISNIPKLLSHGTVQQVLTRYPGTAPDFIPLQISHDPKAKSKVKRKKVNINKRKQRYHRLHDGHSEAAPAFIIGGVSQGEFTASSSGQTSQPEVLRSCGVLDGNRHEGKNVISKGPTMLVGGADFQQIEGLRPIVIDGSNVAMSHGLHSVFSAKGIDLVVKYFASRGHQKIVAFVPQFRSKPNQSTDRELLEKLNKSGNLVYTPSREVGSKRITSYDDAFILDYAAMHGGIVVSRDNFRDLATEKAEWRAVVEERILMPTFIGDDVMFPNDPLGRNGPNLDEFLRF